MNSYERMVGDVNKLYYDKTTTISRDAVVYNNVWELQWNNPLAIQRVYQVSKLLGKCPDIVGRKPGQSAIWYNPVSKVGTGQYHKFEIQDQAYQHTKPMRHADFLFVWLRMKMKPEKAADINKITSSAFYYEPGQLVCTACHFIGASIATMSILKEYNDCKISLSEARHEYDIRIGELLKEFLESEKTEDIQNFSTPLRDIYETYIMSDVPPEEVFTAPCGCKNDVNISVDIEINGEPMVSLEKDTQQLSESRKIASSRPIQTVGPSEAELIRELTMSSLESKLIKSGTKSSGSLSTEPKISAADFQNGISSEPTLVNFTDNEVEYPSLLRLEKLGSVSGSNFSEMSPTPLTSDNEMIVSSAPVSQPLSSEPLVNRSLTILPGV